MNIEPFKATFYTRGEFERRWAVSGKVTGPNLAPGAPCEICRIPSLCVGTQIAKGVLGIPYMKYSPICSEICFNLWLLRCQKN